MNLECPKCLHQEKLPDCLSPGEHVSLCPKCKTKFSFLMCGKTNHSAGTFGIGSEPTGDNWSGGMTEAELKAYVKGYKRLKASGAVQGRLVPTPRSTPAKPDDPTQP
jgi:hypothetical protein